MRTSITRLMKANRQTIRYDIKSDLSPPHFSFTKLKPRDISVKINRIFEWYNLPLCHAFTSSDEHLFIPKQIFI